MGRLMGKSPAFRPFRVALSLLLVGALGLGPAFPARASAPTVAVAESRQNGAPVLSATKTDALVVDVDGDTLPDPGDTLRYTIVVTNNGSMDALGVVLSDTLDAHTTLTG